MSVFQNGRDHVGKQTQQLELLSGESVVVDLGSDEKDACDCVTRSQAKSELGWSPTHDFDAGLRATVRWYLDNPKWIEDVRSGAYREWIEENYGDR